jgi:dipeptidyl aminopeptidase/acylaminoacyl peptidase
MKCIFALVLCALSLTTFAQVDLDYQEPAKEILELVDIDPTPRALIDDKGEYMLLLSYNSFKTLEAVAAEEWRLAGLRIDPKTNGYSRTRFNSGIVVKNIETGKETPVAGIPVGAKLSNFGWSPDNKLFAFTMSEPSGISLWVLDVKDAVVEKLTQPILNDVFGGNPYTWRPNSKALICRARTNVDKEINRELVLAKGPTIQQNEGKKAPARTYQDLLKNKNDEVNFDFFAKSELLNVGLDGVATKFKSEGIYRSINISPDGNFVMVSEIQKPYSYLVPYYRFPYVNTIYDKSGKLVKEVGSFPLVEEMPKGFDAVRLGPRDMSWRKDKPATLYWTEALDGGDPKSEVEFRDALYDMRIDKLGDKREIVKVKNRLYYVEWGDDHLAVVHDGFWKTRKKRVYSIDPSKTAQVGELLYDLDRDNYYDRPGNFLTKKNAFGSKVLLLSKDGKYLYQTSEGYSPEGNKPYVAKFDLETKISSELWRASGVDNYERIIKVLDIDQGWLVTRIESNELQPNYYKRNIFERSAPKAITDFSHPYEQMKGVKKEVIHYTREDGVDLSATLYLPAGYDKEKDGRLPMLMWAYPREYKNAKQAGQVKKSPHEFTRLYYGSPIYWVASGYAVLDGADFPIIGEGETEPNDSFIEQLVMNAEAGINAVNKLGVVDPKRVAVGGHSYGAFMTANLLAHSDLFAAGIARSGAYNRSLTPFGFQSEERTFWEATDVYMKMSPFMHADKVNQPLLLIHGEADNNSGTFPMQSERFYNAMKGHGATTRLVMLPYESHGYAARESVLHMLWEMDQWLEKYVKNKTE